jgi:hypothetical protein
MIGLLIIVNLLSMVICYQSPSREKQIGGIGFLSPYFLARLPFRSCFLQARLKGERKAREGL